MLHKGGGILELVLNGFGQFLDPDFGLYLWEIAYLSYLKTKLSINYQIMIGHSKFGNCDVDTVQDGGIWSTQTRRKRNRLSTGGTFSEKNSKDIFVKSLETQ